jgi:glyoxylase-like metal-dependent hydrolase (beta-lactamase superfamily II)
VTALGPALPVFAELGPGLRRLLAPNPSLMTGPGTNTYLFGVDEVAVLDPGPVIDRHLQAIVDTAAAPIRWVLVTHTHPDHSPAAVELARRTGAELLGRSAPVGRHQDMTFRPSRELADGERIVVDGIELEVIHTPGHASNHLCYRQVALDWIFTGDHIIDGSTVVIDPPDGNMSHYLKSLVEVKGRQAKVLAPGHGELIHDPARAIDWIVDHRLQREATVVASLGENPGLTPMQLVPLVYKDVNEKLYSWAERSLLAHLLKLADDQRATESDGAWWPASLDSRNNIA